MKHNPGPKTATIVVNTLNRYQHLKTLLESFNYLDYGNFEVVVVNGPSTDDTHDLLMEWSDKIKIGHCPEANLSISRNIGIAMAAGDFVAFIDDDAIPEPEWLSQAVDAFERENIGGVGGPIFDHTGYIYQYYSVSTDRLGHAKFKISSPCPYNCFPGSYEFPHLAGGNAIFRRSALLEIGGFDEEYEYHLDETDVCLRLVDAGYELVQLSNSFIHHKNAPSYIRNNEHRVHKYRYPMLKNQVYFSNRHGRMYYTQNEIDNDNLVFIDKNRKEIKQAIADKILQDSDLEDFEQHAKDALENGRQAVNFKQKLITPELLKLNEAPFKRFQTIECDGEPLTIVFLCENNASNQNEDAKCIVRDKAHEIAALGHKVHIISYGSDHNTVDFEQGVWVHRILPLDSAKSDSVNEFNIPQENWNQSKAFLDELDRISTFRRIDVVQAPIINLVGSAALLSERYCVITTLSADDAGLFVVGGSTGSDVIYEVDETQQELMLYLIKNSHGILTDNMEMFSDIDVLSEAENMHEKLRSSIQPVQVLIQDYKKLLKS